MFLKDAAFAASHLDMKFQMLLGIIMLFPFVEMSEMMLESSYSKNENSLMSVAPGFH